MTPQKHPTIRSEIDIDGMPYTLVYAAHRPEEDAYYGVVVKRGAITHYLTRPQNDESVEALHASIVKELLYDHHIEQNGQSAESQIQEHEETIANLKNAILKGLLTEKAANSLIAARLQEIEKIKDNPANAYTPPQHNALSEKELNALVAAHQIITDPSGQQFVACPINESLEPVPIAHYLNEVAKTLEFGHDLELAVTRGGNYIPVPRSVRIELQRMDKPPSPAYNSGNICPN